MFAMFAMFVLGACSKDSASTKSGTRTSAAASKGSKTEDSAAGSVDLRGAGYTPGALTTVGAIAGTVALDGPPRSDTIPVTVDLPACGKVAEGPVHATATGLSNAVVWIADMKSGKAFPVNRRIDLASEDCALDPRVQATVVGTTVNVTNDDRLLHKLVFTPIGSHDTLTVMPFFNNGQVVASERLARRSGIVEVYCVMHPWTHAYIAVFDHPYYAVTGANGAFRIDSVPPGTYKLMVWHEGAAKAVEQQVEVGANGTATAVVKIGVK